jgi:hypothetical protein
MRFLMSARNLNAAYSQPNVRRRYEVWFLRFGLADGSGAWWIRYLLLNLGRGGCYAHSRGMPVQVWATWFPRGGTPQSFVQGFRAEGLSLSKRGASPLRLVHGENRIGEDSCQGMLSVEGHYLRWDLRYRSTYSGALSDRGRTGFSRTPHSDATFAGEIIFDGRAFRGDPLGYGLQGHNSGSRYRRMWTWTHAIFLDEDGPGLSSFEALEYELPLGMRYRRAALWLAREVHVFKKFENMRRDAENLTWAFECTNKRKGLRLQATIEGSGPSCHRLPYVKTNCSGTFDVANNSFAKATFVLSRPGLSSIEVATEGAAVIEMAGA